MVGTAVNQPEEHSCRRSVDIVVAMHPCTLAAILPMQGHLAHCAPRLEGARAH